MEALNVPFHVSRRAPDRASVSAVTPERRELIRTLIGPCVQALMEGRYDFVEHVTHGRMRTADQLRAEVLAYPAALTSLPDGWWDDQEVYQPDEQVDFYVMFTDLPTALSDRPELQAEWDIDFRDDADRPALPCLGVRVP